MKTYTKAVSATLAGALAVGMVPAMALADAPDAELDLLTMTPAEAFDAGYVSAVKENISDLDDIEFKWTGDAVSVTPTKVMPGTGAEITLDNTYACKYYVAEYDAKGKLDERATLAGSEIPAPSAVGKYVVVVTKTAYAPAAVFLEFAIVAKSLDGLTFYEPNALAADGGLSDEEFVYSGSRFAIADGNLAAKLDGKPFAFANTTKVETYKKGENGLYDVHNGDVVDAGEYLFVREGKAGSEYAGSKVRVPFTIEKADLSKLDLTLANCTASATDYTNKLGSIGGKDNGVLAGLDADDITLTLTGFDGPAVAPGGKGEYTYTLAPTKAYTEGAQVNLINTAKIKFYVADEKLAADRLFYGDQPVSNVVKDGNPASGIQMTIDHSLAQADLDFSKFSFCETSTYGKDEKVATSYVITDALTNEVVTDPSKPGVYNVAISVDAKATEYAYMSDAYAFELTVTDGTVDESEIAVLYNGKVVGDFEVTYTGEDIVKGIQVVATTDEGEKTLTAGKEYNYKIVDNDTGKEVSSIVNVNEKGYTLKIVGGTYSIIGSSSDLEIDITVLPITPLDIRVANTVTMLDASGATVTGLPYTGSEIVPTYEYYTAQDVEAAKLAAKAADKTGWDTDEAVYGPYIQWTKLPTDVYVAKLAADGEAFTVANPANGKVDIVGTYTMELDEAKDVVNYVVDDTVTFKVINASVFKDVPAGKWYTEAVMQAYTLRYMNGIGNGLFQPMGTVTRGMAACILYNMAGEAGDDDVQLGEITNGLVGFVTPFEDVDAYKWYARAIQWAEKADIVNGYGDGAMYGPDDEITREQWACMLGNYAKVYGGFKAPAADALAGFPDAGKVSSWAKESVAWAVENGIMGNGGSINPKAEISRAEAAAMAVNFQPKKLA